MKVYKLEGEEWKAVQILCEKRLPDGTWRIVGLMNKRLIVDDRYAERADKIVNRVQNANSGDEPKGDEITGDEPEGDKAEY
jgi:hypothetical protein